MKKILKDPGEIQDLLKVYKAEGYSRIHLPGGTSKEGDHYAGVIAYYYDKSSKQFAFVGMPYDPNFHKRDSNSEGHKKKLKETPEQTAFRELFEESGLKAKLDDFIMVNYEERKDNRPGREGNVHRKYFFMIDIDKCTGELSSFEGPNQIDGETLAPLLFVKSEFHKVIFPGHQVALLKAIEKLKAISLDFYEATFK